MVEITMEQENNNVVINQEEDFDLEQLNEELDEEIFKIQNEINKIKLENLKKELIIEKLNMDLI